ncbi:MAG: FAD-binding oxidoreductase, partial [Mycobacteriales bacterium]
FYPQSFERSTVGGWVATRAAGHFSARLQHVDDLVESIRAVTPVGVWESRRLPGSGAGPSPDRLLLGSEGTLGVITEVWLRVQPRPVHRARATLTAPSFHTGAAALRDLTQSGLAPATCRLIDAPEFALTGGVELPPDTAAVLTLGAESADAPVERELSLAVELARAAGLRELLPAEQGPGAGRGWQDGFRRAPYLREQLLLLGVLAETFETATTWDRLEALVQSVREHTESALRAVYGAGRVTCRVTHAYSDGAAPYFTVLAPARRGSELAQWAEIKAAASEAVLAAGGTITHHHAVGRDHRTWYDRQRPAPFAAALAAAKRAVDPAGILNPGVLLAAQPGFNNGRDPA